MSLVNDEREVLRVEEYRRKNLIKPYVKVFISGNVVEFYEIDRKPHIRTDFCEDDAVLEEGNCSDNQDGVEEEKVDRTKEGRANSTRRARNNVRRLCLANFDNHSKFVTLTFKENVKDVREANKWFKKFIQRMHYKYGDFKYVAVIEFQKRGAVHYHMMCDLPYIPNVELQYIWKGFRFRGKEGSPYYCVYAKDTPAGFVRINDITNVDNVGAYMIKYMLKDTDDIRLRGLKSYQASKGLIKPLILTGIEAEGILESFQGKEKVFANSYTSEYCGNVTYKEFNLRRV